METFVLEKLDEKDLHKIVKLYGEMENYFKDTNTFMPIEDFANQYLSRCEMCGEIVFDEEMDYRLNWEERPKRMCKECQEENDRLEQEVYDDRSDYEFDSYRDYKLENGEL